VSRPVRIALLGLALESNRFAPTTTEADFRSHAWLEGEALVRTLNSPHVCRFGERMDALRAWTPVPILYAAAESGGPCDEALFLRFLDLVRERFAAAGPVDGVFIFGHGAGLTTARDDMDGPYFSLVRELVGRNVPIVAELDYHANISEEMFRSCDALVGYLTNPHVDIAERGADCADLMHAALTGRRLRSAMLRLPLVTPQVTQLTAPGEPAGDLIALAAAARPASVRSFSVFPGFAFADSRHNGFAVLACGEDAEAAQGFCRDLAWRAWDDRDRYRRALTPLDQAVRLACAAGDDARARPLALADVADNPGGGGRGNTAFLLEALVRADARGAVVGVHYDPPLAAEAHERGVGAAFAARFNREETTRFSLPFTTPARVDALTDGRFVNTRGVAAGRPIDLGPSALLAVGGVRVAVSSLRHQVLSPDYFSHFGVALDAVRSFAVKSRGHFRAGFAGTIDEDRIFEVDAPGLTTPHLAGVDWAGLQRPIHPLDAGATWSGQDLMTR
jgi:microcystin degradation protein MlrC